MKLCLLIFIYLLSLFIPSTIHLISIKILFSSSILIWSFLMYLSLPLHCLVTSFHLLSLSIYFSHSFFPRLTPFTYPRESKDETSVTITSHTWFVWLCLITLIVWNYLKSRVPEQTRCFLARPVNLVMPFISYVSSLLCFLGFV